MPSVFAFVSTSEDQKIFEVYHRNVSVGMVWSDGGLWYADQFGTSLIPVRDELNRLVAERGLAMLPSRTVCVPRMARARFQELLQVRLSLE